MHPRRVTILDLVQNEDRVKVRQLADRFHVSPMTIRRDLSLLEDQGYLVRTHGGAVVAGRLRFLQRAFPHYTVSKRKAAIGKLAATLVQPGQTVMVDTGTTALEVARNLPKDAGITVATTSLCVAQELYGAPLTVLLLGGFLRKEFPSLYGPLTESLLKGFHVDILFMGCEGADSLQGFYTVDLHISSLEQATIEISDRVVVVTESSKFARKSFVRYARPEQIDTLVTDAGLSVTDRKNLEKHGIKILFVEEE